MRRLILIVLVALATNARADTSARAKADATAAYADGQRRYLAEDYEGAAKQFLTAYNLDPDPAYLFNVAQAYRFAKLCARSAKYYRKFLGVMRNPPNKADVAKYIADQDACAKTQPPDVEPEPKPEPKPDPKPDPQPIKVEPPKRDPAPPADPGRLRKRLALVSFAVGAVGVGIGAAFGAKVESTEKERNRLCEDEKAAMVPCPQFASEDKRLQSQADSATLKMVTGFAVGAAAIGAGVFLYITGKQRSEDVAVTPTPAKKLGRLVRAALLVAPNGAVVSLTFSR